MLAALLVPSPAVLLSGSLRSLGWVRRAFRYAALQSYTLQVYRTVVPVANSNSKVLVVATRPELGSHKCAHEPGSRAGSAHPWILRGEYVPHCRGLRRPNRLRLTIAALVADLAIMSGPPKVCATSPTAKTSAASKVTMRRILSDNIPVE